MTEANVNEHAAAMVERKASREEGRSARAEEEAATVVAGAQGRRYRRQS